MLGRIVSKRRVGGNAREVMLEIEDESGIIAVSCRKLNVLDGNLVVKVCVRVFGVIEEVEGRRIVVADRMFAVNGSVSEELG